MINRCVERNCNKPVCEIKQKKICEGLVQCSGLDECDIGCPSAYRCKGTGKCVSRDTVCNGEISNGCPEDEEWENGIGFKCLRNGKICLLPQQLLYDDIQDCDYGEDMCFVKPVAAGPIM